MEFIGLIVQVVNLILLTANETDRLRKLLRCSHKPESPELSEAELKQILEGKAVFKALFRSWCHSPVSTLSLCLASEAYGLGAELIRRFTEIEISLKMLVEIDRLIQLLESPAFVRLRLQLLDDRTFAHEDLLYCLYGLMMLLPGSPSYNTSYDTLRRRLKSAAQLHAVTIKQRGAMPAIAEIDKKKKRRGSASIGAAGRDAGADQSVSAFSEELECFDAVSRMHAEARQQTIDSRKLNFEDEERNLLGRDDLSARISMRNVAGGSAHDRKSTPSSAADGGVRL